MALVIVPPSGRRTIAAIAEIDIVLHEVLGEKEEEEELEVADLHREALEEAHLIDHKILEADLEFAVNSLAPQAPPPAARQ